MLRQSVILAAVLSAAACATSRTADIEPVPAEATPAPAAESDAPAGDIEVAEIPDVPASTAVVNRNERICRNEKRTGTNRVTRVCRTRAEIEQMEAESKEVFKDLHRSQEDYR